MMTDWTFGSRKPMHVVIYTCLSSTPDVIYDAMKTKCEMSHCYCYEEMKRGPCCQQHMKTTQIKFMFNLMYVSAKFANK